MDQDEARKLPVSDSQLGHRRSWDASHAHDSCAPRRTPAGRVWFFGAGIAMVLSASLNLLNSAYGAGARGVRWVCIGNNLLMTCFAVAAGVFTDASPAQFAIVLGLVGGATMLSFLPSR